MQGWQKNFSKKNQEPKLAHFQRIRCSIFFSILKDTLLVSNSKTSGILGFVTGLTVIIPHFVTTFPKNYPHFVTEFFKICCSLLQKSLNLSLDLLHRYV